MVLVSDNVVIVQLGGDNGARGKGKRLSFLIYRAGQRAGLGGFGPKSLIHPNPRFSHISPFSPIFGSVTYVFVLKLEVLDLSRNQFQGHISQVGVVSDYNLSKAENK
ncbi:hypothetical protein KIW84_043595 [Lathyrus oleraceus]|uniref:Uncharacterized protein n=1 Tax=Pisum sativum TaxID=3888 RepID=A0A9D4XG54_PEA|nr:hypothetical protein KIW84_043595 [Pisum sativum]